MFLFIVKENNRHYRRKKFGFFSFWKGRIKTNTRTLVVYLVNDRTDALKFHHLLLQFLRNSDYFDAYVFTHNTDNFLFAFVL